ncbi:hypothetical protein ACTQ50_04215 [Blautia sp. Sow4_E7]|uniref:hypothetical protein n=1 Tax=Blautia sp. Sow4_E7 TaxID=3438749 RepID=UPI003F902149
MWHVETDFFALAVFLIMLIKEHSQRKTKMIPYAVYLLLAATNPFTSWFFKLTSDMEYSRGPLFMSLGVGFIMLYSVIGFVLADHQCQLCSGLCMVRYHHRGTAPESPLPGNQ